MDTHSIVLHGRNSISDRQRSPLLLPASLSALHGTQKKSSGYISALVHEVRNPLCNINLALEMLQMTNPDEDQSAYINIIARGAGRINDLINKILRSEQIGRAASEFCSLQQLLEEVLYIAKDRIALKKIAVCRDFAVTEQSVWLDKEKIKVALTNIVVNAIDAMSEEKGELKVVTKSVFGQNFIEIQDNGIGISKENLKEIFKPYFTNKKGGMGLGLSATLEILRANNASVEVRSEEGAGTTFILSFNRR